MIINKSKISFPINGNNLKNAAKIFFLYLQHEFN